MSAANQPYPADPVALVRAFLDANEKGDAEQMKMYLCEETLNSGDFTGPEDQFNGLQIGEPEQSEGMTIVPILPPPEHAEEPPFPAVIIEEKGQLKFSLVKSMQVLFGGEGGLEGIMNEMVSTLESTMGAVAGAMEDAFDKVFGASEEDIASLPTWEEHEPYPDASELKPLPVMIPLPQTQAAISEAVGHEITVHMAVHQPLEAMTAEWREQVDVMSNWMDTSFLKNMAEVFSRVNGEIPLAGRCNALRIYPAINESSPFIIADGNAIVWQTRNIFTPGEKGQYSTDQFIEIFRGVAAGLPDEILSQYEGLCEHEYGTDYVRYDRDAYFDNVLPRAMRRISMLLGRGVNLRMDSNLRYEGVGSEVWYRWGPHRAIGGIALAMMDPDLAERIRSNLTTIATVIDTNDARQIRLDDSGVLTISVPTYAKDEDGCFSEHQIADALAGNEIFIEDFF